ncbi:hypothetical protein ABIC84_002077 [Mucilaginibacter sp. 3215]
MKSKNASYILPKQPKQNLLNTNSPQNKNAPDNIGGVSSLILTIICCFTITSCNVLQIAFASVKRTNQLSMVLLDP